MSDLFPLIALVVVAAISYKMPEYLARAAGYSDLLDAAWMFAKNDGNASLIAFWAIYMMAGFAMWTMPIYVLYKSFNYLKTPSGRKFVLIPFTPLIFWSEEKIETWKEQRRERRTIREDRRSERGKMEELYHEMGGKEAFVSFRAFEDYFNHMSENGYINPETPFALSLDPYRDAVDLLGLEGGFDERTLAERHRRLIKQVHPDVAGPSGLTRRLNEARDVIRKQRGWKK